MPKFAICAEHFVRDGAMARWAELARANADASLREVECERYDVLIDREQPNHAFLCEVYESRGAWLAHCQQPHFRAFVEGVKDLVERRVRAEYDVLD